jgi:hypothetical protein
VDKSQCLIYTVKTAGRLALEVIGGNGRSDRPGAQAAILYWETKP